MELHRHSWLFKVAMIAILGIVLTACGGGDDDADPTATTEPEEAQPTVVDEGAGEGDEVVDLVSTPDDAPDSTPAATIPVNTDMSSPDSREPLATPGEDTGASTPASSDEPAGLEGTPGPDADSPGAVTTDATPQPTSVETEPAEGGETTGTPVSDDEPVEEDADVATGDGTTGAVDAGDVVATPEAEASPVADASEEDDADATPEAPTDPIVVEGCEVAEVPAYTGETTSYVLSVDVNFRAGPGTDCDQIGDGPLGEFTAVEVIGGPLMRAGDDEFQWVQVQVGESTGWLAFEFLEPAGE